MEIFSFLEHSLKYRSYKEIEDFKIPKIHTEPHLSVPDLTQHRELATSFIHSCLRAGSGQMTVSKSNVP